MLQFLFCDIRRRLHRRQKRSLEEACEAPPVRAFPAKLATERPVQERPARSTAPAETSQPSTSARPGSANFQRVPIIRLVRTVEDLMHLCRIDGGLLTKVSTGSGCCGSRSPKQ